MPVLCAVAFHAGPNASHGHPRTLPRIAVQADDTVGGASLSSAAAHAMILAAGLGTRLRPLTEELPKPLMWVGDRPLLSLLVQRFVAAGIVDIALNTHHLAQAFSSPLLVGEAANLSILHESQILGTAGGVANARAVLGDADVVVWNGDILADLDVAALVDGHHATGGIATLAVAPRLCGEGTVGLAKDGRVVRLRGERFGTECRGGDFVGIQVIGPALRGALPSVGCLVGDAYLPALRSGQTIGTFEFGGTWEDIGTVTAYLAANARWLRDAGLVNYVGRGAHVGPNVEPVLSVIGAGAEVTGTGILRGVVVWPGARARAPLAGAVVTTGGAIVGAP